MHENFMVWQNITILGNKIATLICIPSKSDITEFIFLIRKVDNEINNEGICPILVICDINKLYKIILETFTKLKDAHDLCNIIKFVSQFDLYQSSM